MRRAGDVALIVAALVVPGLAGCYAYSRVEPGTPERGTEVRATISEREAGRLGRADLLSSGNVLTGVVREATDDSLTLSVRGRELRGVQRFGSVRDTVAVAMRGVEQLETRRMQPFRTAALAVAAGGGMVGLFAVLMDGAGRGGNDIGGDDPMLLIRIPLSR